MSVCWTPKQLEAIDAKGKNILVAAAAGSGKTAVLVERIIRMISDKENPVSVDRLLVLTFTDAAATEMKRKIAAAIDKKLEDSPDDVWLKEQAIKVNSACISTIHSFCRRIITNNSHLTNLPSDFSLIDETENKILEERAIDAVMESYYSRIDKKDGFRSLVMGWSEVKGDNNLRELVSSLHNLSRSFSSPRKWLCNLCNDYYSSVKNNNSIECSAWVGQIKNNICSSAATISNILSSIISIIDKEIPTDHKYYEYYYNMYHSFCDIYSKLDTNTKEGFAELCELISNYTIGRAPSKTGVEDIEPRLSYLRDKHLKINLASAQSMLTIFNDENIKKISACQPAVKALINIVRLTEKVHQKYKRERSAIDFNDLEHNLFNLLCDRYGAETPLCLKLRDYYHEIMIDEFQDTSCLQFDIFKLLAKKEGNLFMVGDIKQSIYKFRNADPTIFIDLYKAYKNEDGGHLICLNQNFRSRNEVINSINDIFESVMSEDCGDVNYTDEERLVLGASYPPNSNCETEVMITDTSDSETRDKLLLALETENIEARAIANRIYDLVCKEHFMVYDKDTDSMREAEYGDIAVLCKTKYDRNIIENELINLGINSITEGGQHYLSTIEVSTIIAFLQIIDNPIQDIPLIAVMRSAMFGFTAEELAQIRTAAKGRYYTALTEAAKNNKKASDFLNMLNNFRACSKYMCVDELVRKICKDTGYFAIVGAMPNGELRKANLKLLLERCTDFDNGSLTGLFNFIKYIEMLKSTNEDLVPAKETFSDNSAVRIMTMHKSKGLEFPVVIIFQLEKSFNRSGSNENIIWDVKSGIGMDYVDIRQRVRFEMPSRELIKNNILTASASEEMRLLYVAMTRAKEKLILSSSLLPKSSRSGNDWVKAEYDNEHHLLPFIVKNMKNMRDWIYASLLNHSDGKILRDIAGRHDIVPRTDTNGSFKIYTVDFNNNSNISDSVTDTDNEYDTNTDFNSDAIDYVYPYMHLNTLPIKLSVSELKRRRMPEDNNVSYLNSVPGTLATTEDYGAAEIGTITHFFLQHIDIYKTDTLDDLEQQLDEMVKKSVLNISQKNAVDIDSVYRFFESDLGKRLKSADRFEREYDFYMLVPPTELDESINTDMSDDIILQGIADCFFFEKDGIVLIDYKTDRVSENNAVKRAKSYETQIEYYSAGLSAIFDLPVKERYIYFLNCKRAVKL